METAKPPKLFKKLNVTFVIRIYQVSGHSRPTNKSYTINFYSIGTSNDLHCLYKPNKKIYNIEAGQTKLFQGFANNFKFHYNIKNQSLNSIIVVSLNLLFTKKY